MREKRVFNNIDFVIPMIQPSVPLKKEINKIKIKENMINFINVYIIVVSDMYD